jgi:HEPN domain-containing protein
MRPEVRKWFNRAEEELAVAEWTLAGQKHGATVFHCQQTVEMALKGLYVLQNSEDAPRTHSLVFLGHKTGTLE